MAEIRQYNSDMSATLSTWQQIKQHPELKARYLVREQVLDGIRSFFKQRGFTETETPVLARCPGTEPFLEVFSTTLKAHGLKDQPAYLLTSPEFALKKLVVAGFGSVFEICKSFRNNEGVSGRHNPEFTILEWYHSPGDYFDVMTDFELLFQYLLQRLRSWSTHQAPAMSQLYGEHSLVYQGRTFNLQSPFPRITVAEAFARYVGVDTTALLDRDTLLAVARQKGYQVTSKTTWEEVYDQFMLNVIEPALAQLDQPVFLYDYPASQAALSKRKTSDPRFAERFEVYLGGLELGNAFSELTDATEQEARFREELALRARLGKTKYDLDEDYLMALQAGLPPTGGIAVGVDRLIMLLANATSIEETLFFPASELFITEN